MEKRQSHIRDNGKRYEVVHQDGSRAIDSKRFALFVGFSQPDARSVSLMGSAPVQLEITL